MDSKATFLHIAASSILVLMLQGQHADANPTYRWIDDNGNPVLSDRPPPTNKPYTEIELRTGIKRYAKSATAALATSFPLTETITPKGTAVAVADVNQSALPSVSEAECAALDADLEKLKHYPRIIVRDDMDGEHLVGAEERATRLEEALAFSEKFCRR